MVAIGIPSFHILTILDDLVSTASTLGPTTATGSATNVLLFFAMVFHLLHNLILYYTYIITCPQWELNVKDFAPPTKAYWSGPTTVASGLPDIQTQQGIAVY
jgi:hypothetical protein